VHKRDGPSRWQVRPLPFLVLAATFFILLSTAQGQGAKKTGAEISISDPDGGHVRERNEWFYRGRVVRGLPSAEFRRRAYHTKFQLRAQRAIVLPHASPAVSFSVGSWLPLGPVPLASDASGNGTQDYHSAHSEMPVKGNLPPPAMWVPLAAIVIGASASGNRNRTEAQQLSGCVVLFLLMMVLISCAGVSGGGGGGGQPPPPATYHITVTGSSSGTPPDAGQSANVTLVVN
jgi:hypothetical protein